MRSTKGTLTTKKRTIAILGMGVFGNLGMKQLKSSGEEAKETLLKKENAQSLSPSLFLALSLLYFPLEFLSIGNLLST